ncbi:hypothetical protein QYF61_026166 [Mycteria americana]|uniref:Uncharacterized protein n=1 Tax=Mycteria americana TaxID=33587 RepID=A0AAN7RUK8_MYCAM|nr:hypothetical protein QYF61_026166 [Mycteria americana]
MGTPPLPWAACTMPDNPFSEVTFPNIQSKPPLAQLEAISSHPITCYLGEETDPHLSTTSFQAVVESDKVSPQPPFLQAEQPQLPQPLPISLVLQTLHQLRCPSLDTLQPLNVSLVVRGPKLNTVFEVRPHQCRVQGNYHCPSPDGHSISDTSQDALGLLGHLGTLLAHIQPAVNQHPQVLFCQAAFQPLFPQPVALHGVAVAQVQDLALSLVEPHTIGPSPSIQPVQVPLQSLPTLKQINTPAQLGVICKLTEGALDPLIQIIDRDIKQNWPQHRALGNSACDRPPTTVKEKPWALSWGVCIAGLQLLFSALKKKRYKHASLQAAESQNRIGWKRPLRSSSPTINLTLPRPPLHHVPKHLIQTSFKYLQGWRLNHFPGQPVPMLDNPFSEVKFPNIQSKPPLAQLEAISSCPITCYLGEETDPHLSTASFQAVVESDKVSPQPPFLQAKQSQLPQPLPTRLVLQTLHQLRCPSR